MPWQARGTAAHPLVTGRETERQVGAGTAILQRAVPALVQEVAARGERGQVLFPRGNRVGPIEAHQLRDRLPQRVHLLLPAAVRETRAPPSLVTRLPRRTSWSRSSTRARGTGRTARDTVCCTAPTQFRRLVLQQVRIVGVDRQHRVPGANVLGESVRKPGRELLEGIARRVLEARELQRLVAPQRLDKLRAGLVGTLGDASNQRGRLERRAAVGERPDDQQPLAGLQVEGNPNGQIAVERECSVEVSRHSV